MRLIPIIPEILEQPEVRDSDFLVEVCRSTLRMYPPSAPPTPWLGYLASIDSEVVGTCAFKSPPREQGVEIAYFTFPPHEGRGIATAMATQLVALAHQAGEYQVRAQTLPEGNASTRVLEKRGFSKAGLVVHPEDGEVWDWVLTQSTDSSRLVG